MSFKVYYVDDESELCEIFADAFASPQVEVTTFTDPVIAIAEVAKNPPDLIFLDYRMPVMMGDQLAAEMNCDIPMHLVTGDLDVVSKFEFKSLIRKPYAIEQIQDVIASIMGRQNSVV